MSDWERGNWSKQLASSIDGKAILISDDPMGIFHCTMSTGQFSVAANEVYLIEDGSIGHPLQPLSVAGNYYDGFRKLGAVGSDTTLGAYQVRSPSLLLEGFTVVGQERMLHQTIGESRTKASLIWRHIAAYCTSVTIAH